MPWGCFFLVRMWTWTSLKKIWLSVGQCWLKIFWSLQKAWPERRVSLKQIRNPQHTPTASVTGCCSKHVHVIEYTCPIKVRREMQLRTRDKTLELFLQMLYKLKILNNIFCILISPSIFFHEFQMPYLHANFSVVIWHLENVASEFLALYFYKSNLFQCFQYENTKKIQVSLLFMKL